MIAWRTSKPAIYGGHDEGSSGWTYGYAVLLPSGWIVNDTWQINYTYVANEIQTRLINSYGSDLTYVGYKDIGSISSYSEELYEKLSKMNWPANPQCTELSYRHYHGTRGIGICCKPKNTYEGSRLIYQKRNIQIIE